MVDTSGDLSQVVAETDENGNLKASYVRGHDLISIKSESDKWYYVCDGRGSVRQLLDEDGNVTDSYSYDAYGTLLTKDGDTDNSYMYVGEEYNANTGLYYLRARYMNPSTGTFTTMDSYQGSIYEPVSLHKYAYANANPVTYTDPSGYFSIAETSIGQAIQASLNNIAQLNCLQRVMLWANAVCTSYDVYIATMDLLYGNGKILDILGSLIKGMTIGMLITCMLTLPIAIVTRPLLMAYGIKEQSELLLAAIEKGDPIEIGVRVLQCITLVYGFGAQCFTGDTLVETDEGLVAIEDIEVGDYVLAEDTVTGEREYKEVLDVHVSQTTKLVHVVTTDNDSESTINTTDNHPFYVEGKGWVPAIELEAGDVLRSADDDVEVVNDVYVEYLDEPVLIYNLEIEGYHTYFVSDESILVHNECGPNNEGGTSSMPNKGFSSFDDLKKYLGSPGEGNAWHHIVEQSQINKSGFSSNEVNNVNNIIAIPHGKGSVHAKISGYYSSIPASGFTNGLTVRQWLSGQSFQQQFDFGMNVLKQYGDVIETSNGWEFIPFD